ncbi:MAG: 3-hydroxyacyl-CoA dehydrogenase family protein, partial [Tissierellia bacterium]|nr:3-hydroxyacyl-CoA dehydrogenase family protein [Tissierellia bacterium]
LGIRWAIVGPNLNGDLNGGPGGIAQYFGPKYLGGFNEALSVMDDWKEFPLEYAEKYGVKGVEKAKANRDPETGQTVQEIIQYRDKMLINILKLHKKI